MRLYLKMLALILACLPLVHLSTRGAWPGGSIIFDFRVLRAEMCGSSADQDQLAEECARAAAVRNGREAVYELGHRYRILLARRLSEAARRAGGTICDLERDRITAQCAAEVYTPAAVSRAMNRPLNAQPAKARYPNRSSP